MIRGNRPPALSVCCPWCGAAPDTWCRKTSGHRSRYAVAFFVHPSRAEAVRQTVPAATGALWGSLDPDSQS